MSGYTKLFGSILASTIWELPATTKVVWITMLAMADPDGEVQASVPGLAKFAGVTREECETALSAFLAPDPDSRTQEREGRRIEAIDGGWRLINHGKYREQMSIDDRRSRAAVRQQRFRESHKVTPAVTLSNASSRSVAPGDASNDTQIQTHKQTQKDPEIVTSPPARDGVAVYSSTFLTFWEAYPRKVGKGDAWKAWKRLKPELSATLGAIAQQRDAIDWRKENGKYIPNPATWLNGRRWEDEPGRIAPSPRLPGPPIAVAELAAAKAHELEEAAERERAAAAERFKQDRQRDAGGTT